MDINVKKLNIEIINDWLRYFDNELIKNNDEWSGCFCTCYQWTSEFNNERSWNCTTLDAPYNRACAIKLIERGKMQGYLAYHDDKVIGWCNANDKDEYENVNFTIPKFDEENKKIKAIVCFNVTKEYRGQGVASRILEKIIYDAKEDNYDYIEAYPFMENANHNYHGPEVLYIKYDFVKCDTISGCHIYRKYLK